MAFGLSGSLSAYFMYIFALLCVTVSTEWQIKMLACLLGEMPGVDERFARVGWFSPN